MNRVIISGVLALGVCFSGLLAQKPPQPKSKGEVEALQAVFGAQDPDAKIKAAENVMVKYKDTEFKPILLLMIAQIYQSKSDTDNAILYGEQVLQADAHNYQAKVLLAETYALRTKEFDLDKDEKLAQVEKYANGAIEDVKNASKPNPNLTDEQWDAAKKDLTAQAHQALGLAAMIRKKLDVAISEFKTAVETASSPDPATQVRLASVYDMTGKYDDALAILDKLMAQPDLHPAIRQFAQAERVRALQGKGGGAKPATPPAPAAPAAPPAPPAPKP
jgi:tetratricopeptide (TPR) repeat protein